MSSGVQRRQPPRTVLAIVTAFLCGAVVVYYEGSAFHLNSMRQPSYQSQSAAFVEKEPRDLSLLRRVLKNMEDEAEALEYETPPKLLHMMVKTPYGDVEDHHTVVDVECPRYVTMLKPQHGMGHQIGTYTTALVTALFFNLTLAHSPFRDDSWHGKYPGIADFTGLAEGELALADVEKRVQKVIDIHHMPMEPRTEDLIELYEPLRKAFNEEYGRECNVLFRVHEYYSYDYGSFTKNVMARKFHEAPKRKPIRLLYHPDEFIIGVHVRVGDITPTSQDYFVRVLSQLLPFLQGGEGGVIIPYRVHVFAEGKGQQDFPRLVETVGASRVVFHGDLPPFESFYHLTQPHVLVMSASGFSQFSAILGLRSLQFSPPSREAFPLRFCPPGAVCCKADGTIEAEGLVRLQARRDKWQRWTKLKRDIDDLRKVIDKDSVILTETVSEA